MRYNLMILTVFVALACASPAAFGQSPTSSEDEQILEQGAAKDDKPRQSKADDEMDDEELDEQVFYSGFGIGRVGTDYINLGEAINIEGVIGFRIPTAPWFGLEIDLGQTIIPGESKTLAAGTPTSNCSPADELLGLCTSGGNDPATTDPDELAMQALGLSLALKSSGRFYVTGKYGYRYLLTSIDELNDKRSGNGFGIGVGYRWGRGLSGVELGYKQLGEDVESIGLTFFVRSPRR